MSQSVSPQEAAQRLDDNPALLYLDVRSVEEFCESHPPGALNLPIFLIDPRTRRMTPNSEFSEVSRRILDPGIPLLVGCASGQRSLRAIVVLEELGFDATNVDGGFNGRRGPMGDLICKGWAQWNLPTEAGDGDERSWASLQERTSR